MKSKKNVIYRALGVTPTELFSYADGNEINRLLQKATASDKIHWRPVGDNGENAGQIKIGSDPIKSASEIMGSNMIDAHAARFMEENPGAKVQSPRDVIEQRCGFPKGHFYDMSVRNQKFQDAAQGSQVIFRGKIERGEQPTSVTFDVRDYGIGVHAYDVADTLCGLGGGSKTFLNWYQGAFGQGSKQLLAFANYIPGIDFTTCQMIVTRHYQTDEVTVSFIRRNSRKGIARTEIWEYAVNPDTGKPFVIPADAVDFEAGTMIRVYNYPMGVKASGKFSDNQSFPKQLRRVLPDPYAPVLMKDERTTSASNRTWHKYLNSKRAEVYFTGSVYDLQKDKKVTFQKEWTLNLGSGSNVKLRAYVLDHDAPSDYIQSYVDVEHPICLTVNGQTHGELSKHLLTKFAGLTALHKKLIVIADLDAVSWTLKNNIFSSTRESTRVTEDLRKLEKAIVSTLGSDEDLQELNRDYRNKSAAKTSKDEEQAVNREVLKYITDKHRNTDMGGMKDNEREDPKPPRPEPTPIPVNDPPTMLELRGGDSRDVSPNTTFTVRIDTDAHPDLFTDSKTFMVSSPYPWLTYHGCSNKDGGRKTFVFKVSAVAPLDVSATVDFVLNPPNGTQLSCQLEVNTIEAKPAEPKDKGLPFDFTSVDDEHLLQSLDMKLSDVSVLKSERDGDMIYINLLNPEYQADLDKWRADGRVAQVDDLLQNYRVKYKANAIIASYEIYTEVSEEIKEQGADETSEDKFQQIDEMEKLIRCGTKSAFRTLRRHLTTVDQINKL